jgi:two-component system, cell cycle sensor histidine kinase and response regulator CckA
MSSQPAERNALQEAEENFRILAALTSDFVYVVHVEKGGQRFRNVWLSESFERVFGRKLQEVRRIHWRQFVHPDDQYLILERISLLLAGRVFRGEARIFDHEGNVRWLADHARPLLDPQSGEVFKVIGVLKDVTERKLAEQRRIDIEARAVSARNLESLGALAAGIAHDFNNILVGILGHTDLAFEHLPPGDPAGGHLEEIGRAAQHAADLAQQLLDYSGSARFKSKELDLSGLVAEMSRLLEVSVKKRAAIAFSLAPGLARIEADPTQLRQVLMNLVINAADAVAEGSGRIIVRTGQVDSLAAPIFSPDESFLAEGGPGVFIEVEDNGCGMDDNTRRHLFEPFYTTKVTGRGLGMATVLGIVRGHHGAIEVETRLGQGSRLRVLLPVRLGRPAPLEEAAAKPAELACRGLPC